MEAEERTKYDGSFISWFISWQEICQECNGRRVKEGKKTKCSVCGGKGWIWKEKKQERKFS